MRQPIDARPQGDNGPIVSQVPRRKQLRYQMHDYEYDEYVASVVVCGQDTRAPSSATEPSRPPTCAKVLLRSMDVRLVS